MSSSDLLLNYLTSLNTEGPPNSHFHSYLFQLTLKCPGCCLSVSSTKYLNNVGDSVKLLGLLQNPAESKHSLVSFLKMSSFFSSSDPESSMAASSFCSFLLYYLRVFASLRRRYQPADQRHLCFSCIKVRVESSASGEL